VSVPERHYELAGRLLARAVTDAEREGVPVRDARGQAAHDVGEALGARVRDRVAADADAEAVLAATREVLAECGYEPRADDDGMSLVNCPFHALAQEYTELVCGMNLELMRGVADALDPIRFEPCLDPAPGRCCVRLLTSTMG
jgi:predicted ArsR family transcriptional regulator